jgi:hypothetical protein
MRSTYFVPFKNKIVIADHWPIPLLGGQCRVIERSDGQAEALEVVFAGEPVSYAPSIGRAPGNRFSTINIRDRRLIMLKRYLEDSIAFVECFHNIELATEEIEARYEAEYAAEEAQLPITSWKRGRSDLPLHLTFDMFTRAFMAAEKSAGPRFETTLAASAREALVEERFIDSFRYSFLLIEALYGEGQFKKAGLVRALAGNAAFVAAIRAALRDPHPPGPPDNSPTATFLAGHPTVEDIIGHLVEMRGFYFHGNVQRKDAWKPNEQGTAKTLAFFAVGVVHQVTNQASAPMFAPELARRHFEDASKIGATIVFEVTYKFREPEENFSRGGKMDITTPGTKITPKQANYVAQEFLKYFENTLPAAALESAVCNTKGSSRKVFEIIFHVDGAATTEGTAKA